MFCFVLIKYGRSLFYIYYFLPFNAKTLLHILTTHLFGYLHRDCLFQCPYGWEVSCGYDKVSGICVSIIHEVLSYILNALFPEIYFILNYVYVGWGVGNVHMSTDALDGRSTDIPWN